MKKVVSLDEKRAEFTFKKKQGEFKEYLASLQLDELRHEANFIIDRMGEENLENEFLLKGAMLMEELASRIEGDRMSERISLFAESLKRKMDPEKNIH